MKKRSKGWLLSLLFCAISYGQNTYEIKGEIIDAISKTTLSGAHIHINNQNTITDSKGTFFIQNLSQGSYKITVVYLGYHPYERTIQLSKNKHLKIHLNQKETSLNEVIVEGANGKIKTRKDTYTKQSISKDFLQENRGNSLMQTLEKVAGISTINIGASQSKPVIRGLGFNRVVVVQNGIKHEAQQWGIDHGLEIDQHDVQHVEIIKGASSLLYGSDAIAGVVNIKPNKLLKPNTLNGEVNLKTQSNNNLYAGSIGINQRYTNWYYRTRVTYQDYGDYKVPTDKIYYENYIFNLHNNQLRNTAGIEQNGSFGLGYISDKFLTETYISSVYAKNGFFANAHGLEVRLSKIDYDSDNRDIDLPYHNVRHFKATNNSTLFFDNHKMMFELGYQHNKREEYSEPSAHGYMPKPTNTKEREFIKSTYSLNAKDVFKPFNTHKTTLGLNFEHQNNSIGGWGFLIPKYTRFTIGGFIHDTFNLSEKLFAQVGVRYDYGRINTKPYFEWFLSPVLGSTQQEYRQRSKKRGLTYGSFSTSLGISYLTKKSTYKINLGKSFRMPLANELASDGVNYHMYRYEKGNIDLSPEESYQIDTEVDFNWSKVSLNISPFINYFTNFIYLNPTSKYYETLQIYEYTQSKVLRYGGEFSIRYRPTKNLLVTGSVEYVKSRQLSGVKKNFTLPFSPPLSSLISVNYTANKFWVFSQSKFFADFRITDAQNEIVPPEKPTNDYTKLDLGISATLPFFNKNAIDILVKLNNTLNTKIFNHTSFYRLIEVPEPGRNLSITLNYKF
ncbi:TonB-dependent receptor [Aquimarina longa]|uniref:TonB-dependent receptor n=1 Tax=Aquimarina longa TaxID=1080221 RepID=UPI000782853D|nr:TonB-dependent receptor [Aquimarina longa]